MFANLKASFAYITVSNVFRILPAKKRFTFWKVCRTILAINIVIGLLSIIVSSAFTDIFRQDIYSIPAFWIDQVFVIIFHIAFYYIALNYYYYLIAEKKGFFHYLSFSLVPIAIYVAYLTAKGYLPEVPYSKTGAKTKPDLEVISYLVGLLFHVGLSLLIAYFTSLRDEKRQRAILEEEKMQLEIEKSNANLNFLKAQINPHFLHNTLNFLYAKSLPYSPELSEGILTLSDIMRYALSEGNLKNGKAALQDEIEHVRNVIKIHQLRYNNSLHVNFEVNGVVNGTTIIPFVLITIVENAFKHGDLKSTEYPIDIQLTIDNQGLHFYCRNKKKTGPKELSTGIGLDNIKKRLDLAYKDQYTLAIKDERELYTTQLTILSL